MVGSLAADCYPRCVNAFRRPSVLSISLAMALLAPSLTLAVVSPHRSTRAAAVVPFSPPSPAAAEAFALGRMLALENSLPMALEQLAIAAREAPKDPYVRLELASVHQRMRHASDAAREARQAIALAPDDADVLATAAETLAPLVDDDPSVLVDVRRALERVVQLRPGDPQALQMLSRVYLAQ